MTTQAKTPKILVCDDSFHARRLVADVLNGAGFDRVTFATEGNELLNRTVEQSPEIVITSSRIPNLSGLEYTRMIRAGFHTVKRTTAIIVMTNTPTQKFVEAARESGVDEMLVRPFTGAAILARVEAVMLRPRRFVESADYVGPCRRRRMLEEYGGPLRRFTDPTGIASGQLWEAEGNRELVRECVTKISEISRDLTQGDRQKLREVYEAVASTESLADEVRDQMMGDAARSLGRYISAMGASGPLDPEVFRTHIDAMQKLGALGARHVAEREELVQGLVAVVDKRIKRKTRAA